MRVATRAERRGHTRTTTPIVQLDALDRQTLLRGAAVVLQEPAEPFVADDRSVVIHGRRGWHDELVVETLMVPLAMIVLNELADRMAKMPLAERHDAVQAFGFDAEHEAFCVRVYVGAARGQTEGLHARTWSAGQRGSGVT